MTAEIVVMNQSAVAMAADSAVTIQTPTGHKTYNSVNKVFTLSKYQPVGVMIYGSAQIMSIPWESIIKEFRKGLGRKSHATIEKYANEFWKFLNKSTQLFPEQLQGENVRQTLHYYFSTITKKIKEAIESKFQNNIKVNDQVIIAETRQIIRGEYESWKSAEYLKNIGQNDEEELLNKYSNIIDETRNLCFQKSILTEDMENQLRSISVWLFLKNNFAPWFSGVVIAGFGAKEIFPSMYHYRVECIVNNRAKVRLNYKDTIDHQNRSSISPFAQSEMVETFMTGIDPRYRQVFSQYTADMYKKIGDLIINQGIVNQSNGKVLGTIFQGATEELFSKMKEYEQRNHIAPVLSAVEHLPKDELALMAETLVNITSFKRKVSLDLETVGGAIDVAVISKGDGFIWIKRKHYFKPEFNLHFMENYFQTD